MDGNEADATDRWPGTGPGEVSGTRARLRIAPEHVVDVLVYVVVLGLAIEYLPMVISEGFTLSLLTALLLKLVLEGVLWVKTRVVRRLRAATTIPARIGAALLVWVTAAGSKLVVLGAVDLVFGDAVSLGGFWSVTLLVVTLLVTRGLVRRLLITDTPAG